MYTCIFVYIIYIGGCSRNRVEQVDCPESRSLQRLISNRYETDKSDNSERLISYRHESDKSDNRVTGLQIIRPVTIKLMTQS